MTETAYQIFIHWTIAYCISLVSIGLKWHMGCQQIAPDAVCPTVKGVLGITLIIRHRAEMESAVQMFLLPIRDEQAHITRLWQYVECTISTETKRLIPCLVKEWLPPSMPIRIISPVVTTIGEFNAARCWKRVKRYTDSEQAHTTRLWQYVECTISTETKRLIPCLVKEWLPPRMPIRTISPVVTRIGEFNAARCWKRVKRCTDSIRLRKQASSQAQERINGRQ